MTKQATDPNEGLVPEYPGYRGRLTRAQVARLMRAVETSKIEKKNNQSYLPQHEARAELIRIFGPGGSDHKMTRPELVYETMLVDGDPQYPTSAKDRNKPYWVACYMVGCDLFIYDYWGRLVYNCMEWHAEENAPLPNRGEAHAMAITSAQSYALRRSLISLGDSFGLHLYDKGSTAPIVGRTYLLDDPASPLYKAPAPTGDTPAQNKEDAQAPARDGKRADTDRIQAAMNVREGS